MTSIQNEPTTRASTACLAGVGHASALLASSEFSGARRALAHFDKPECLASLRQHLAAEGPRQPSWQFASRLLGIGWDDAPAHVNIPVKGELGFLVERRVWQSAIFATFVARNLNPTFGRRAVIEWCRSALGQRSDFAILQEHKHLLSRDERKALPQASRAVRAYLRSLARLGYIASCGDGRYEILHR